MSNQNGNSGREHAQSANLDGEPISMRTHDFFPVDFNDHGRYMRPPSPVEIYWLLTAAMSGIVGNLAYDALKVVVRRAIDLYQEYSKTVPATRDHYYELTRDETKAFDADPPAELRDHLITIASETLRRNKGISPSGGAQAWSEIKISFTACGTWLVAIREIGESRSYVIEIDLEEGTKNTRPNAAGGDPGFPVRIWF